MVELSVRERAMTTPPLESEVVARFLSLATFPKVLLAYFFFKGSKEVRREQ